MGLGFRVPSLGFRVPSLGSRVSSLRFRDLRWAAVKELKLLEQRLPIIYYLHKV